jgi:pilus assembly protein TadC
MIKIFVDNTQDYETMARLTKGVADVQLFLELPVKEQPKKHRRKYRITPRFYYILFIIILYLILFLLDTPNALFTSMYWRGF